MQVSLQGNSTLMTREEGEKGNRKGELLTSLSIVHPSFIRTPLVTRMLANPRFKGYVLEPQTVVDAIVENLLKSRSGQINIPGRVGFWSYLRAFPVWLQVGLRNREAWGFKRIQEPQK